MSRINSVFAVALVATVAVAAASSHVVPQSSSTSVGRPYNHFIQNYYGHKLPTVTQSSSTSHDGRTFTAKASSILVGPHGLKISSHQARVLSQSSSTSVNGPTTAVKRTKIGNCILVETTTTYKNGAGKHRYKYNCNHQARRLRFSVHQARPVVTQSSSTTPGGATTLVKTTKQNGCTLVETTTTYPDGRQAYRYTQNCRHQSRFPAQIFFSGRQARRVISQSSSTSVNGHTVAVKRTKVDNCILVETTTTYKNGASKFHYKYNCKHQVAPRINWLHRQVTQSSSTSVNGPTVAVKRTKVGGCVLVETTTTYKNGERSYRYQYTCRH